VNYTDNERKQSLEERGLGLNPVLEFTKQLIQDKKLAAVRQRKAEAASSRHGTTPVLKAKFISQGGSCLTFIWLN
jgi:hypothetical protein